MMRGLQLAASVGALALMTSGALAQLKLTPIASGLTIPVDVCADPAHPNRLFVLQQRGIIRVIENGVLLPDPAINLTSTVSNSGSEKGLLGMAIDPQNPNTVYLSYTVGNTSTSTTSRISKHNRNGAIIEPGASIDIIFSLTQPFVNHNGGNINFGPDGFLYVGLGDGGSANDPGNRAQNLTNLLGKMLRIDVRADDFPADTNKDYRIPPGQPFTVTGGTLAPEIWAFGLRNPWKHSFDNPAFLGSGAHLIADVGQDNWEEINYTPLGGSARNYGWRPREGNSNTGLSGGPNTEYRAPIWVYNHSVGISITGGYVYRGIRLGDFFGRYFFSDFGANRVWSLKLTVNGITGEASVVPSGDVTEHTADMDIAGLGFQGISSIDEDVNGELYVIDYGNGTVYRIDPQDRAWAKTLTTRWGVKLGGEVRSLSAIDGKTVDFAATNSADTRDGDAGVIYALFTHNKVSVSTIQVAATVSSNQPSGHVAHIGLRNWNTKRIDRVLAMNLSPTMTTFTTSAVAAANYIQAGTNDIEVSVAGDAMFPLVSPVTTSVDQIKVTVN